MSRISAKPSRTLIFNPRKKLIAIVQSNTAAARMFNTNVQAIHYACSGRCISCKGFYFRDIDDTIEITFEDLGTLGLKEYDEMCGIERKIFKNTAMSRKGMKYNKKTKKNATSKSDKQVGQ